MNNKIGVGIIGAGGWAQYGHIPALQALENFEIIAISTRRKEAAINCATKFNIPFAYADEEALISHPDVELVVILAPAPEHARIAKAVIAAGKDVYSEWPLTTKTSDSEELLDLAEAKGVQHIVGLQRRFGQSARYTRDLIKQGYVGQIRGVHMTVNADAFGAIMSSKHSWVFPLSSFSNILSVYAAHFGDMLFQLVGFPQNLAAVIETQLPFFTIKETGEQIPNTHPNEVMVMGTLKNGGLFSIQIEGGQQHQTGLQIDITGTEGILRITNSKAFENKDDNFIQGVNGSGTMLSSLPVPSQYHSLSVSHLDASSQDVAYLYDAYARDKLNGTSEATNFKDAIKQHEFIDQIYESSKNFKKTIMNI